MEKKNQPENAPWYATEEDRIYEEAVARIKAAVAQGMSFEQASSLIGIKDDLVRESVLDDALKVLIAEMHLIGKKPLKEVSKKLGLPVERLEIAKKEMIEDIKQTAIDTYKTETGQVGNA